ncbi:hypothetical protein HPC38_02510 [Pasteurellaceae bacterium HPA106]|uniref:BRO family protein n=1 Tax=Spirabiliibacterium pneumoniae TaxID=221400 RepID=UPI001AAD7760|nr:BRO family protein [Spirabiliibacterium pneumoniae]MBE2895752.1 hypothetical protein [Spirabiliibacterium pneumoniae]
MTNQVQTFNFKSNIVRAELINSEPHFCLADVCAVMDIKNSRDVAYRYLDKKGVVTADTLTNGGKQELTFINEPNLYRIIFKSRKAEAVEFQNWVFDEVLPQIRKTGKYEKAEISKPQKLSAEHQQFIKDFVKNRTLQLPKDKQAKGAIVQWSALKTHFGKTYKEIDDAQFVEAVGLLARLPLEGELLDGTTALLPKNDFRTSWNDDELKNLASFWCATYEMHDTLRRLEPILNMLGSTFHPRVFSQVHEYKSLIRSVHSRLVRDIDHLQYADPHDRHWQYCLETINRFNQPKVKRLSY